MRKVILAAIALGGALVPGVAMAGAREDVIAGISRCAGLADDRQWLDCYYGAAQPMRASLGLSPAPQSQIRLQAGVPVRPVIPVRPVAAAAATGAVVASAAPVRRAPPMPRKSGIFDVFGGSDVVNNAPVQSYEVNADGFTVTLMDGQVWQQTDEDASKFPVRWRQPAESMRVTIAQGALHSFNLVMNDETQHHKVTRIH
jgi:hypothetical protein